MAVALGIVVIWCCGAVQAFHSQGHVVQMILVLASLALPAALTACAQGPRAQSVASPEQASALTPRLKMSRGEVRKIDKQTGMLTLHCDPVENLRLPEMTMMFAVVDRQMLEIVKKGDAVLFTADLVGGKIAVTHLELRR